MTKVSGFALANQIAQEKINNNGKLTPETQKALDANKAESQKNQSIWNKQQQARKEFGRGFQIELEKENRVKAGLPEYDIQQSNNAPARSKKGTTAAEIKQKQQGSDALGELRKKSRAKALVAKAEHQAETQSASGKHIHKELKEAKKLDPTSVKDVNEKELIQLFNKYGIYLVIEDALPSTKIRGCSMVKGNNPCIYITRYFEEKASFYFTLYHELGHVKKDYNRLKNKIIINDDDNEKDIDNYALNEMIDSNTWNKIKVNINDLEHICRENNIPLCFAYYRLAYEGIISYGSKEYNEHKEKIN